MELIMNLAVDDLGLEAGVCVAKGYCRCHDGSELNHFQRQSLRKSWRRRLSSCSQQRSLFLPLYGISRLRYDEYAPDIPTKGNALSENVDRLLHINFAINRNKLQMTDPLSIAASVVGVAVPLRVRGL